MTIPVALRGIFKAYRSCAVLRGRRRQEPAARGGILTLAATLRWGNPHRGGEDWRRDTADHPGLGDAV